MTETEYQYVATGEYRCRTGTFSRVRASVRASRLPVVSGRFGDPLRHRIGPRMAIGWIDTVILSRKDVSDEQDVSGTPDVSDVPDVSDARGGSDTPVFSDMHVALDAPVVPGDSEQHVLDCPVCAGPITRRMTRCPGCDAFLILGFPLGQARSIPPVGLVAGGLVIGLMIGLVIMLTLRGSPSAGAGSAGPSAAASAEVTGRGPVKAPAGAAAALTGTLAINRRIAADSDALKATLRRNRQTSADIASGVRSLAADAVVGLDLVGRLAPWIEARPVMSDLTALYRSVSVEASAALRISYSNERAYRKAAKALLKTLDRLDKVDATARTLAASVGLTSASPGASSAP